MAIPYSPVLILWWLLVSLMISSKKRRLLLDNVTMHTKRPIFTELIIENYLGTITLINRDIPSNYVAAGVPYKVINIYKQ